MNPRIPFIDSLRGLAVIFMIQQHLLSWLWEKKWISYAITFHEHPVMLTINFMGNFAAPLFLILAGTGAAMLGNKPGISKSEFIKRGTFILLCGYALNYFSPHWFRPGSWYVLHTIGISIIISPLLMRLKTVYLIIISLFIIIIPGFIQTWLNTPLMTGDSFMNDLSRSGGILRLAFAEGHFPVFPWSAFFISGIICHRWISENKRNYILFSSVTAFTAGFMLKGFYNYGYFFATGGKLFRVFVFTPYIYPAHPSFMFILLGTALIFFYMFTSIKHESAPVRITAVIGRLSLTWFFLHIILFNEILRFCGIHRNIYAAGTLLIIAAFLLIISLLSMKWKKTEYKYSLEWFMRRILKLQKHA
jgi:uncharacterized membrane protein